MPCKSYSHFCSKNINAFENTLATTVNEFVINKLNNQRMLWPGLSIHVKVNDRPWREITLVWKYLGVKSLRLVPLWEEIHHKWNKFYSYCWNSKIIEVNHKTPEILQKTTFSIFFYYHISEKIRFDMIHMKGEALLSLKKNNNKKIKMSSTAVVIGAIRVK